MRLRWKARRPRKMLRMVTRYSRLMATIIGVMPHSSRVSGCCPASSKSFATWTLPFQVAACRADAPIFPKWKSSQELVLVWAESVAAVCFRHVQVDVTVSLLSQRG
jgi:hypothetical protein